jgi:nucleoid DNA-binding protein
MVIFRIFVFMTLAPYLQELLAHRNYVILSGFGAFQPGRLLPVEINEKEELLPPRRGVTFNALLTNRDDTLAQFIAEREQREVEAVVDDLNRLVFEWKTALNDGKEVEITGVGSFVKKESMIVLRPKATLEVHRESFGLPVIQKPGAKTAPQTAFSKASTEDPNKEIAYTSSEIAEEESAFKEVVELSPKFAATDAWYVAAMCSFGAAVVIMLYVLSTLYTSLFS